MIEIRSAFLEVTDEGYGAAKRWVAAVQVLHPTATIRFRYGDVPGGADYRIQFDLREKTDPQTMASVYRGLRLMYIWCRYKDERNDADAPTF